jgi:two-component system, OmpR family, KDP operon response regulator KdpE
MTGAGASILLVEDDEPTRSRLRQYLERRGYGVREAATVGDALRSWDAHRADLILLDLGLPDRDGVEVVRHVRRDGTTPIIIVSARGEERDRVAGLDAGADDYVTKPFGMDELQARIRAVLRRAAGPAADAEGRLDLGPIVLDPIRREVHVAGAPVHLTPREYELLKALMANRGRVVTKARLLRAVWGVAYADESQYLHVYVNRIRRKLAAVDPAGATRDLITAEPGVGYRVADPDDGPGAPDPHAPIV